MTQRHAIGLLRAVLTGPARPFTRPGSRSAIDKAPRTGPVDAGPLGLAVCAGDTVWRIARPFPGWSVARLLQLIAERNADPSVLAEVLALPLPPSWQRLFRRRLDSGQAEDWAARLQGSRPD